MNEPVADAADSTQSQSQSPSFRIPIAILVVAVLSGSYYLFADFSSSSSGETEVEAAAEGTGEAEVGSRDTVDQKMREMIIGRWTSDRNGKRDLIVREDGTATMKVTITSWHRHLFADEMKFDIDWSIEDGVLSFITTGGEPEAAVTAVLKLYGKSRDQPIIKLDDKQMVLKDADEGEPDHLYERIEAGESST